MHYGIRSNGIGRTIALLAIFGLLFIAIAAPRTVAASSAGNTRALRPQSQAGMTWQARIGAENADHALQVQAFVPDLLTINEGDTVTWSMNTAFVHTVTFLSGGSPPPDPIPSEGPGSPLMLNPQSAFPSGGPAYDGTGYANSGLLLGAGTAAASVFPQTFSLTFSTAGTHIYVCLLHPGMAARLVVQPAGSAYPMTQEQVTAQGDAEIQTRLNTARQHQGAAVPAPVANADGTMLHTVRNGAGGGQGSVLQFLPGELHVRAGDKVAWPIDDPHEIHSVTFFDPKGQVPPFLVPQPQDTGPPKLIIPFGLPTGGTTVDRKNLPNSGIYIPGASATFTFTEPGTYQYVCVIHAEQGMFGTIVVDPAAVAPPPVTLPNTGAGSPWTTILILLASALALLAIGRRLAHRVVA